MNLDEYGRIAKCCEGQCRFSNIHSRGTPHPRKLLIRLEYMIQRIRILVRVKANFKK
jgi:hypothetical protein